MKIDFAVLYDDNTWDRKIVNVPFTEDSQLTDIQVWAELQLCEEDSIFGSGIRVLIFNDSPEEEP